MRSTLISAHTLCSFSQSEAREAFLRVRVDEMILTVELGKSEEGFNLEQQEINPSAVR